VKPGDLVKRKEGYMGHKMCGIGLVLFADDIVTRVQWQGNYGTFMQVPETLEVVSEAR
jgi:hypothetical protein|tara:strand:- start:7432 stop:7605 length:174 start_codon:yes stop_codon:yes gene_type:complete